MKIDVVLTPAEIALLPGRDLSASTAVVFDVLRATSTILAALANGASSIRPVATLEEAWALRKILPDVLVGGERDGLKVGGLHFGNAPLEYTREAIAGREIIQTTTNGTVALRSVAGAKCALIGALLNLDALAAYLRAALPEHLLLVCAGSWTEFSLEDALAAGGLMARLPEAESTDPGTLVSLVHQRFGMEPYSCLRSSRNGRRLVNIGLGEDVAYCSRSSSSALVPEMRDGVILPPLKS